MQPWRMPAYCRCNLSHPTRIAVGALVTCPKKSIEREGVKNQNGAAKIQ